MSKELANEFARWLERRGAQLKPVTNQWEAVRWSPADGSATHVMYLKKNGQESFSGEGARQVWCCFLGDDEDEPAPVPAPTPAPGHVYHLVGAAPQMLAALKVALKYIEDHNCQDRAAAAPALQIQQAIALAEKGPQA
jgi:hypothetical protein